MGFLKTMIYSIASSPHLPLPDEALGYLRG